MLSYFSFPLKPSSPNGIVVFLHGLGDVGKSWASFFEPMTLQDPVFKDIVFIFPDAPKRSVTINMGMKMPAWYDIYSLDPSIPEMDIKEDQTGLDTSSNQLLELLSELEKKYNIPKSRIILGGFSQGGALSIYTILKHQQLMNLGGIIALSAYLPCSKQWINITNANIPIFMGHGTSDFIVSYDWGVKSFQKLKQLGFSNIHFKSYTGMDHSACQEEQIHAGEFIKNIFSNTK